MIGGGRRCRQFSRLLSERADRELTTRENKFLQAHRQSCQSCAREEAISQASLNMLRLADVGESVSPQFEARVLRRYQVDRVRSGVQYWSPALIGGVLACAGLCWMLQFLGTPKTTPRLSNPNAQVRRNVETVRLDLGSTPIRLR